MSRFRSKRKKDKLFKRVRRRQVRYIAILPSLITLLNGIFGFMAIMFASMGADKGPGGFSYFAMAGYMVLLGMFADMLDGRLARMSQSTSSFGGQLDSLCDMISFGIAPAFIVFKVIEVHLEVTTPWNGNLFHRFVWLATLAYISCTAIRLARFNVENEEDESAHMSFIGLPSPAAAGVVVSVIIFHQEVVRSYVGILAYSMPFLLLGTAVLMVSRIRYPHILNLYLRGKKPFSYLIRVLFFLGVVWWNMQAALVLIFGFFTCSGFVKWLYWRIVTKKHSTGSSEQTPPEPHPEGSNPQTQGQ